MGIGCGIYLAEYGRDRFGDLVRFTADVLNGVPSIVIGIAVYSLIVIRQKHFSAFSGGVALAIMMIPTIARATEEMLLMVPNNVREAALGLGIPKWRTTLVDHVAHRVGRSDHGMHAGVCARGGRNRAAAVYRLRQPVLEQEAQSADGGPVRCRSLPMPFRPLTSGTGRRGRAR